MNRVTLIGRLGSLPEMRSMSSGERVVNFSIATDEGYKDKKTGDWVDRTEWHRCVTFQKGLVEMLEKHGEKGRLVVVEGKLKHDKVKGKDGKEDRYYTSVLVDMQGSIKFLTPKAKGDNQSEAQEAQEAQETSNGNG